jgi:hypothetical protein
MRTDSKARRDHDPPFKPFAPLALGVYYRMVDDKHGFKTTSEGCINELNISPSCRIGPLD